MEKEISKMQKEMKEMKEVLSDTNKLVKSALQKLENSKE